jgi:peptidyl-tRNA hydrolase
MGIGDNFSQGKQVNFVLGKWTEAEKADLYHIVDRAIEVVKIFTTLGLERAMNATTPPRPKPEPKPNNPKKSSDL